MGIRIGIVGAGTTVAIADRHVEGFLAQAGRCTVTAVCSRTLEGCRRLCIRHGLDGVRMTTRLEELLDVVDAVVLCTPNQFHLPYTERSVERGKAVLLEKPLGLQTAPPGQAERLLARRDARVMVAYVYRYTAVVERLRALLRQRMGRVYLAQASQGGTRLADPAVPPAAARWATSAATCWTCSNMQRAWSWPRPPATAAPSSPPAVRTARETPVWRTTTPLCSAAGGPAGRCAASPSAG